MAYRKRGELPRLVPVKPLAPLTAAQSEEAAADQARTMILQLVTDNPDRVFYSRQLEVLIEGRRRPFHWITNRILRELLAEGVLGLAEEELAPGVRIRFVFRKGLRYYRRALTRSLEVVRRYSDPEVAEACGDQAEVLFLNALAERGFRCVGRNTNRYGERVWTGTGHNLDYIVERDGIPYGSEVKNTLDYIAPEELAVKLQMCRYLGVRPLFILRASPETYNVQVIEAGGYALIFVAQIFPFGFRSLVEDMKRVLGLPADSPKAIPAAMMDRFLLWHSKKVGT